MIRIVSNSKFIAEKEFVIKVLFEEILCVDYAFEISEQETDYVLYLENGNSLYLKNFLFSQNTYLSKDLIPANVEFADFENIPNLPIIFGKNSVEKLDSKIYCGIDIIGSCFYMLSRLEEYVLSEKDEEGRFPCEGSLAYKHGFLKQPVVNMYAELIKKYFAILGEEIEYAHKFSKIVSHDIDYYFKWNKFSDICKTLLGDVFKRKSLATFFKNFSLAVNGKDPYNTIGALMNLSEKHNVKSTFYFLKTPKNEQAIIAKKAKSTCENIIKRGHKVGIHFNHYKQSERTEMSSHVAYWESYFNTSMTCSRQHFLRFSYPETLEVLQSVGIKEDSSLYFRKSIGFRTGCCTPHSLFNVETQKTLQIKELPLSVMDVTLRDYKDVNLAKSELKNLLDIIKKYNGTFVCLWHNSSFDSYEWDAYKKLYEFILNYE